MPEPTFTSSVKGAFSQFQGDFEGIEAEYSRWLGRSDAAQGGVQRGLERGKRQRQNNVELLVSLGCVGLAGRVLQLTEGLVGLVNSGNPHAGPPVARALFEACCLPIYMQRELLPRLEKGRVGPVHKLVFKLGLGGTGSLGGHVKPVAVDSLIKAARMTLKDLEAGIPEDERINAEELVDIYYGPLTDLTHPNWAALSMGTDLSDPFDPKFAQPVAFEPGLMHDVVTSTAFVLEAGGRAFDSVSGALQRTPMDLPNAEPVWGEGEARPLNDRESR